MVDVGPGRRLAAEDSFRMPDLEPLLPRRGRLVTQAPQALRFSFYDTADLRLTRAGVALWFTRLADARFDRERPLGSEATPWQLSVAGRTQAFPGGSATVPPALVALVTAYTRGAPLEPVAVLRYSRVIYEFRDGKGRDLGGVVDDRISVLENRRVRIKLRQLCVEPGLDADHLTKPLVRLLRTAGASERRYAPPHVRALGAAALGAADVPEPAPARPGAGLSDVLTSALRRDVTRIIQTDPLVRLRAVDGVHQMRVAVRRLRSDLKTFGSLLDQDWTAHLRSELRWLGSALGAVRDSEVLRVRLRQTAAADPVAPLDRAALARIDADLAARTEDATAGLDTVLTSPRYLAILDELMIAANDPPGAGRTRPRHLNRLVGEAYHRLVSGAGNGAGARDLGPGDPDEAWHSVRKRAKAARYAAEAAADLDPRAPNLAHALADVSDLLGEHQDAVVAAATWLSVATDDPDDHALAVTAGRLAERDRAYARRVRKRYPKVWAAADRDKLTKWLR
jgi:CHAD domain-containing protein